MAESVDQMRERLRSSLDPVSAFYLVDSQVAINAMLAKAAALGPFGVSGEQLAAIGEAAAEWVRHRAPAPSAPRQLWLEFRVEGRAKQGLVEFADVPGRGIEVQVILPGLVAATAPGFLADGFWCAFMPPSFYD